MASGWQDGGPEDDAKEPIIMTAINEIGLNKWERAEKGVGRGCGGGKKKTHHALIRLALMR